MPEKQKEKLQREDPWTIQTTFSDLESLFQLHTSSSAIVTFYHKRIQN